MDSEASLDLQAICEYIIGVARNAGDIVRTSKSTPKTITVKKNTADIVTETDKRVEDFLHEQLVGQYSRFDFLGEETHKTSSAITDRPTFIVDPIDGTSNFVHGMPDVCISIGLVVGRQPVIGVVYNPIHDELWWASKGHGAFYKRSNGPSQKLPLSWPPLEGLGPACIGIEWGSDREGPNFELNAKVFMALARTTATGGKFTNSLRCTGSAAITICRVAAGQQDAFWECGCWAWDVSAAWCILTEAGGIMVDGHPGNWSPPIDNRRYLAVRPAESGHAPFVEEFWSIIGEQRSTYGP
ncbi:hypothetical protein RBB50_010112 [Rhinocladiella similis]